MLKRCVFNFKFKLLLFVFFLPAFLITTSLGLQAKTPAVEQTTKSCLWTVDTPPNKIYLLGSLHLLKSNDYPLTASINQAYANSQKLVFETDIEAALQPAMLMKIQELGLYPEGDNLFRNLDVHTKNLLEKKMADIGLPLALYTRYKPWLVAQDLTLRELAKLGFNPIYGIDFHFYNKAKTDGKEIGFLEPPEFQINLLGSMIAKYQNELLNQTLNELEVVNELSGDLVGYWKNGDADKLHVLLSKSFKDYPHLHNRLLIQRNKNWVKEIESALKKNKNVLFIVGVGHLVGPESVVDLLKKKGYQVKQQ